ncbi:unnamed protein product [Mytilus edulis]|uniref:DZIP3-like HEPN domain-containing protein n=1 Tax=Mytilus edulis TaxID=6550 RepID=A0A8S3RQ86_MYTED|nr:unnamed protein product [Mytilus edulis]
MDNPEVIKECVVSDIQRLRKLILDERCVEPKDMNAGDKVDHENNKLCSRTPLATNQIVLKKDEVNYLRMVLLLYRVVRPAVRIYFNHEIEPKLLRKTLKKNLTKMKNIYRKKNHSVINDDQWNLLSRNNPGKTVTSDDFDVRLMIYLLKTITTIKLGDLYPTEVDTSIGAMLSRIKFIRNEITQNLHEKLPVDLFNKYWDDMGQAVLELVSSQIVLNVGDKENTQFIEDLLKNEKDQLYHKRQKTKKCCVCEDDKYAIYIKLLPEKQWEELYEVEECTNQHSISCKIKICSTCVVPKKDLKLNVSVLVSLILYIPEILEYFISHFSDEKFEKILNDDQHTIYHSMKKEKCCKCKKDPTEKIILREKDWNTLFEKSDIIICKADKGKPCCCQYSVRKGIKKSSMDNILRCKIFDIAGPFGVINKIEQDALLYFLNWTVHDSSLPELLADLRIKEQLEKTFVNDKSLLDEILQESYYGSHIDGTSTNSRRFPTLYLSEQQRTKRRLPTNDNSEIDLKTMLHFDTENKAYSLNDHSEWKKQLEVINKIRRDIMQSSSGILELERFRDMMNSINKAVLHLEEKTHKADILQLVNNKNILAAVRNENQQHCDVLAGSQTGIMSSSSETTETTIISDTSIPTTQLEGPCNETLSNED